MAPGFLTAPKSLRKTGRSLSSSTHSTSHPQNPLNSPHDPSPQPLSPESFAGYHKRLAHQDLPAFLPAAKLLKRFHPRNVDSQEDGLVVVS